MKVRPIDDIPIDEKVDRQKVNDKFLTLLTERDSSLKRNELLAKSLLTHFRQKKVAN